MPENKRNTLVSSPRVEIRQWRDQLTVRIPEIPPFGWVPLFMRYLAETGRVSSASQVPGDEGVWTLEGVDHSDAVAAVIGRILTELVYHGPIDFTVAVIRDRPHRGMDE